ncbi:unnamed protein product [Brassicogethes aeneus]|uniref:Monocarboxylate transporter 10 n=1 Tax=Brassicogethes aeneus TaxID=1431903 RepID=A0A9P0B1Y2_BRAAE|nr:unnamed protein product [Brassicogethes aeneus]
MVEDKDANLVNGRVEVIAPRSVQQNGTPKKEVATAEEAFTPPDGGTRAWLVMLASFFCNGILFGVINSYSVIYKEFHAIMVEQNITNAAGKSALVGSLAMGTTFLVSPVSGVLTDCIGIRMTTFLGGLIASSGMFLSSFCVDNVTPLSFTYGVMYGLGGALAYTPSLAVLGHYFKRYLGFVNGLVTAGSSAFTIAMPYFIDACIQRFQIEWTLRILAMLSGMIMLFAFLFKPIKKNVKVKKVALSDIFNVSVIKNLKFVIWTTVIAISLFGYFVPYVYINDFVEKNFDKDNDAKLPVLCIGITSGVGRLIFGYIADRPRVNRIFLQQISFLSIGILTILLPFSSHNFSALLAIVLGMGLFDGCFISLLGPIAFDICGKDGATQAIGFLLGVCALPLTIGPYVAGNMLDNKYSFTVIFILAGIPPTIGSVAMFLIQCVKQKKQNVFPMGTRETQEGLITGHQQQLPADRRL